MAEIIDFKISAEEYGKLAKDAFESGDAVKSVSYLHRALREYPNAADISLQLASVYEEIGDPELANDALYFALSKHPSDDFVEQIHNHLAVNLAQMGIEDASYYYMDDEFDGEDFELDYDDEPYENERDLRVVYPKGEDYYRMLINQGRELVRSERFDEAIALMDKVDASSASKDAANHIVLVSLMMKKDIDAVIYNAERMLKEGADRVMVQCALSTAYLLEGRVEDATAVMEELFKEDYTRLDDIFILLPNAVSLKMHSQVLKYATKVLERIKFQPDTMIWRSQALYNLGRIDEAVREMAAVKELYGKHTAAKYFLAIYAQRPESVDYAIALPGSELLERYGKLKDFAVLSPSAAAKLLDGDGPASDEVRELIEWAFDDGAEDLKFILADKLSAARSKWGAEFFKRALVFDAMSFELTTQLLISIINEGGFTLNFDVVAHECFKSISAALPTAFFKLPGALADAVSYCIADIIYVDDDPNLYLERLTQIVNGIVDLDQNGKLQYLSDRGTKIAKLKSVRTIVGAIMFHVYEGEETVEETVKRYGLTQKTFDKYNKIIFGD